MKTPITFNNRMVKILISVVASIYIVFHGREIRLLESLQKPLLYIAITVSFIIVYLMVSIIDYANRWLDKRYDWREETIKRSVSQLVIGISLPLMVDFVIISVYFYFLGTNVFDNGFLRHDFPVIVLFVVVVNMYYITASILANDTNNSQSKIQNQSKEELKLIILPNIQSDEQIVDTVFYFYSANKQIYLVDFDGKEFCINQSLETLSHYFSNDFVRINRSVLLNRKTVQSYEDGNKRNTKRLHFKDDFQPIIDDHGKERFVVTNNYIKVVSRIFNSI